jgi:glucosamine 6-phosphate synthetase-like amidotransferase/phosphosugar isomerase protein
VKARDGLVIAFCNPDDEEEVRRLADTAIPVPATRKLLLPLLDVVPLQLLACSRR